MATGAGKIEYQELMVIQHGPISTSIHTHKESLLPSREKYERRTSGEAARLERIESIQ